MQQAFEPWSSSTNTPKLVSLVTLPAHLLAGLVAVGDVGLPRVVGPFASGRVPPAALLVDREHLAGQLLALLHRLSDGFDTFRIQLMSETCRRPSMPSSISMNAP